MLPLRVGGIVQLNMVLNTGLLISSISGQARQDLIMKELIPPVGGSGYLLTELTIAQHPVADLRVRVRPRVDQLRVDGILGLDFLRQFTDVHFHVPSFRLTLAKR